MSRSSIADTGQRSGPIAANRWFARKHDFEHVATTAIRETPAAGALYAHLAKGARTPELKALGDDLYEHEAVLRDWLQSELSGQSDGGEKVFAYLERHGITRTEAVTPPSPN
jgi:hypothetical protein